MITHRTAFFIGTLILSVKLPAATKVSPLSCDGVFYGTVNYDDVTDQGQHVMRQEIYKFRAWSPEEQFDRVLVKKVPEIIAGGDFKVRVTFKSPSIAGRKSISSLERLARPSAWSRDEKFYVLDDLNLKHLVGAEASIASDFVLAIESNSKVLCSKTFPIRRGD